MPVATARRPATAASLARLAAIAALAVGLGACSQMGGLDLAGSFGTSDAAPQTTAASSPAELEKATAYWGKLHATNPRDGKAALSYARNLKALNRKAEAFAVLQGSYIFNAGDREYLSEFGRLALDQGQVRTAVQLLERADDPAKPDWKTLSARGAALAKLGQYKDAIPFLERARQIAPEQASVKNNLALVYTLDGRADQAATLLREAAAEDVNDPRIRQNLALVMSLQQPAAPGATPAAGPAPANPHAIGRQMRPVVASVHRAQPMTPEQIIAAAQKAEAAKASRTAAAPGSTAIATSSTAR